MQCQFDLQLRTYLEDVPVDCHIEFTWDHRSEYLDAFYTSMSFMIDNEGFYPSDSQLRHWFDEIENAVHETINNARVA